MYDMLVRADRLKIRFQAYCENWKQQDKSDDAGYNVWEDKLSPEEWDGVREIISVLAPFKKLTKQIERREISLQDYIPYFDKILGHLRKTSQRFKGQTHGSNNQTGVYE